MIRDNSLPHYMMLNAAVLFGSMVTASALKWAFKLSLISQSMLLTMTGLCVFIGMAIWALWYLQNMPQNTYQQAGKFTLVFAGLIGLTLGMI